MTSRLDVGFAEHHAKEARRRLHEAEGALASAERYIERIELSLNTPGRWKNRAKLVQEKKRYEAALPRFRAKVEEARGYRNETEAELMAARERYLAEDSTRTAFWEE